MQTLLNLETKTKRNFFILFATALFFWTSMTSLLPILPLYVEDLGGTTQQVGFVMGSFAIGLLFSRSWLGKLADQHSRKIVIIIGTIVVCLAPLGYIMTDSITIMMILRAFHGISIAAFTTGYSALIVDLAPVKNRGELIGYMSLAVPIGMSFGPAFGGYIQQIFGYQPIFLLSSISGLLAFILANQVREISLDNLIIEQKQGQDEPSLNRNFGQLFKEPSLLIPALVLFLIGLVFGNLATFLPLFIREIKIDFNVGLFYTTAAIASFAIRILIGKFSDIIGRGLFITGSLCCYLISMLLLSQMPTPPLLVIAAIAEGSGAGVLIPMMIALMSDRSYPRERGKVYSICIGGFDLGIAIAGPILGSLASIFTYNQLFAIAALMSFLALLVFVTSSNKNIKHSWRFAIGKAKDYYAIS